MPFRTSTSSSEIAAPAWPRAALCAAALVLLVDALFFRAFQPWALFEGHVDWKYERIIRDRLALQALDEVPDDVARVFVFGTSRGEFDFKPENQPELVPAGVHIVNLAHFRMFPPEIRAAVDVIRHEAPATVVLTLSELDTHGPLQLDQRSSFRSLAAMSEIADVLGPRFLFDQREVAMRIALGNLLASYRYRDLLGDAGLDRLRRFRNAHPRSWHLQPDVPITPKQRNVLDRVVARRSVAKDGPADVRADRWKNAKIWGQALMLGTVEPGPHVVAHHALLRRSVEVLRSLGTDVLIVELPLNPEARELVPPGLRDSFLAFTAELERDFGSRTLPLEAQPDYPFEDFFDLTHLSPKGARKFTPATLRAIGQPAPLRR